MQFFWAWVGFPIPITVPCPNRQSPINANPSLWRPHLTVALSTTANREEISASC